MNNTVETNAPLTQLEEIQSNLESNVSRLEGVNYNLERLLSKLNGTEQTDNEKANWKEAYGSLSKLSVVDSKQKEILCSIEDKINRLKEII